MSVVTYDSYGGCPFPCVDVFYEIHVEGKCHYTFADGGAGDAQRDIRQRLQSAAVGEAVLVRVFGVVHYKAQRCFAVFNVVNRDAAIGDELVSFIYVAKNFEAGL